MRNQVFRYSIFADDAGLRIDQVLPRYSEELSRTRLRKLIDLGGVHVAGRRISQCSRIVQAGEQVEIFIDGMPLDSWKLTDEQILFQDPYLLVLNKPAGIETQPTPARYKGTVYHALQAYLVAQNKHNKCSIGMVQRLDRGTSGAMVFSIHPKAHKELTAALVQRKAKKRYLALVSGDLPNNTGEFCSLLARNRATNLMKSVERGGKEAITRFVVLARVPGATLVEVELLTGRTHQIRVHFSEAGHPLLGDVRYGGLEHLAGYRFKSQMLHSWQLGLKHPIDNTPRHFVASLNNNWQMFLKQLGPAQSKINEILSSRLDHKLSSLSSIHE